MHPHLKVCVAHFVFLQVSIREYERGGVTVFNDSPEMAEER